MFFIFYFSPNHSPVLFKVPKEQLKHAEDNHALLLLVSFDDRHRGAFYSFDTACVSLQGVPLSWLVVFFVLFFSDVF